MTIALTETIKQEGGKWVLYAQDGKVLGRFGSEAEAKKRDGQIAAFKAKGAKESAGLALDAAGALVLAEGGRLVLEEGDLAALDDDTLREVRGLMSAKYAEVDSAHRKLGDQRYSTTAGAMLLRDMSYYSNVLWRVECEMVCRLLTLD